MHFLASVAGSTIWLVITAVLWAVAAALFHDENLFLDCTGTPIVSMCVPRVRHDYIVQRLNFADAARLRRSRHSGGQSLRSALSLSSLPASGSVPPAATM